MSSPLNIVALLMFLGLAVGCGSSQPSGPPEMTEALQAEIDAEDAAVEDAERAAAGKPAKKN